ncbi:DSD1 family PLP-dependent enzyme [Legionella worsleiensis]|uniref:Metal-activated pyridoxal enzyme n=1 Tax=Legionella worsleiensis TaxID=45076 RepID=A0A0W1AK33_9GAMM|nr:DSD1 family PLP-dependent enzyme [Legionella worsleiensis]KTD81638.1 metal-activated pyridoxal enzyme [Legionella worsleiensis]STY31953.1 metal-activated pyridoxal enzyme [Legionella worsleiensis]
MDVPLNNLRGVDTPCLLIDLDKLKENIRVMQDYATQVGVGLRPHCKTHKCSRIAQLQLEAGALGISAAKLSEAEQLIQQGISSVLITSPIVSEYKLTRLSRCLKNAPDLLLVVDNPQNAEALNQLGQMLNQPIRVLIDVDPGIGRTGIAPDAALDFALFLQNKPWLQVQGIQCYAGNLQHISDYHERKVASLKTMEMASGLFRALKPLFSEFNILTGSGTGTFDIDPEASEVTEIQPGSYTVMDVQYESIGSRENPRQFNRFKNALTLLTTVISANRKEHVTVDAGTKAIYFDPNYQPRIISHPHLFYDWGGFGDEHGKIMGNAPLPGCAELIEMIVPHCDPTINLYDQYVIVQNNEVIDLWDIDLRGKSQ